MSATAAHSTVEASPRTKAFAGAIVILYAVISIEPL
jgi:multiple sugar transport system permease protein